MKLLGVIGTTGLFFLLGTTAAAYAPLDRQEPGDKPEKHEEKAKPEKQAQEKPVKQEAKPAKQNQEKPAKQEAKQAKQEQDKPAKQEAKQAKQVQDKSAKQGTKQAKQEQNDNHVQQQSHQSAQQSQRDGGNSGGGDHGRISDAHYRSSFGSEHHFHVNQGEFNHHRFSWGGYSFGFIDPWPVGWFYTDYVYVVYDDGGYYMCNVVHPGIRLSINIL